MLCRNAGWSCGSTCAGSAARPVPARSPTWEPTRQTSTSSSTSWESAGPSYGVTARWRPLAAWYAAERPERVDALVLSGPTGGSIPPVALELQRSVAPLDEELYLRTILFWHGAEERESIDRMVELRARTAPQIFESGSGAATARSREEIQRRGFERAEAITAPTLILYSEGPLTDLESVHSTASRIDGAQLRQLHGPSALAYFGGRCRDVRRLSGSSSIARVQRTRPSTQRGFQTVFFTDLEASTALTQQLGDEAAQEVIRGHNSTVRAALGEHGGGEVKHTGDGIMASFPSAVSAVNAALQNPTRPCRRRGACPNRPQTQANRSPRTATSSGRPFSWPPASPTALSRGSVLVSDVVRQLCAGKTFEFTSVGEATLKGFAEPVVLFEAGTA